VRLKESFTRGEVTLVLSDLTVQELASAPTEVRRRLASVSEAYIEVLQLDAEVKDLAEAYVAAVWSAPGCESTLSTSPWQRWPASTSW
jgi:hypothetical protein